MKLSPIARALRAAGFTAQTLGLAIPLTAVLSPNAWADPSSVSAGDASATSFNSAATTVSIPVTRSGDTNYASVVTYSTLDGTAAAPGDYTSNSGSITFAVGATSASINVAIPGQGAQADKQFSLSLLSAAGVGPTPNFTAQQTFAAGGNSPYVATAADFNGDGKADLAIPNGSANSIAVRLNTTAPGATIPTYTAPQTFATGNLPVSSIAADFNGDGKPDLAVANYSSASVSVLINTTAAGATVPSYAAQQTFAAGSNPRMVATADFNLDGKPDLAAANSTSNLASVLLNTTVAGATAPTFAVRQTFATGNNAQGITATDFNGDGKPDLAVSNYGTSSISVLLNTTVAGVTTPTYAAKQTFSTGAGPGGVVSADLNGDGKPDLAIGNEGASSISVLLNNTAPGATLPAYKSQQTFATGSVPQYLTVSDLNGDGKPDLVAPNRGSNTISVLLSTTATGATKSSYAAQQTFTTALAPAAVTAVDFNGDGKPDLAVVNQNANTFSVLLNTTPAPATTFGSGSISPPQTFATGFLPRSVTTADLNGDGKPDLAIANYSSDTVSVLLNTTASGATAPSYGAQQTFATGGNPMSVTAADFNGDGKPDLAVANLSSETVSVLLNTTVAGATTPSYGAQQTFATESIPFSVTTADLNGDGKPDLAVANYVSNTVSVLLNTTAPGATMPSYSTQAAFATGTNPRSVTTADFNGDGKPDLAVADYTYSGVSVLLNTTASGATTASYATQVAVFTETLPTSVTTADLNGDGKPDLVVASEYSSSVSVLLNTTAPGATMPSYATQAAFAIGAGPRSITIADLNGDGKPDLAVANYNSNTVSVLLNTTAAGATMASYAAQQTFATGTQPRSVTTADFNGDGKPDLAVASRGSTRVSVLLNTQYQSTASTTPAIGTIHYVAPPSVSSITRDASSPTNASSVGWSVTFSQPVTGVTADDFALVSTGGVAGASVGTPTTGDGGTTWTVTANSGTGSGTLGLNLIDDDSILNGSVPLGGAGTGNGNFTGQVYSFDKVSPTVTINQASGQGDPTHALPVAFDVLFSESVTGFDETDVVLSGTAAGATASVSGSGTTYTVSVSGVTSAGTVIADISSSAATDAVGNASAASTSTDKQVQYNLPVTTPTPFSFPAKTGVTRSSTVESDSIVVLGLEAPAPISTTGDASAQFCIDGNCLTNGPGIFVDNMNQVTVKITASSAYATQSEAVLHIGGGSAAFDVTTEIDTSPLDLNLSQSASANPVQINSSITYTATVHNNSGTADANGLVLTETLAAGLSYSSFSGSGWSCSAAGQVVTCTLSTLAHGASSSVSIVAATGATAGLVKTVGSVAATNSETVPANNNKNVSTTLCDPAATNSIGFGSTSFPATEGVPVVITVNRSGTSCSSSTVHYATTTSGSAPAADFTATSGDFTWLPLDANKKTFTVNLANDSVFSGNRTVNLALTSPSANATLTKSTSSITIKDDEVPVTIGLSTTDQSVSEEGGVATVTATLSVARAKDTTVLLTITGTANKIKDYTLSATSILIPAGQLAGSVTLTGLTDLLDEANETAIVKMGTVSGVTTSGTTTNTVTFTDDDATPTVSFDTAASTKPENKANAVTLVLSAASGQDVTVNVSSTGGSATAVDDYTINGSGTVTILAGATSATAVHIIDDVLHEGSETAVFNIDSATNATPAGIQSTTLTITDNDP